MSANLENPAMATGKGQPSSQFSRREVLKNVQTTGQLHSFTMWVRLCSKSFKLGFSHYMNQGLPDVQTLGLEKGRKNQKSNCQHLLNHRESKRNQEKHLPLSLSMIKPLTVWIINCGNLLKRWKPLKGMETPNHLCFLINLHSGHEATVRTLYGTTYLFGVWERNMIRLFTVTLFNFNSEHIMQNARLDELQAGIKIVGRNKQPQIWGWYHPNGRKQRGTKEPLDEGEGGEWKNPT